MLLNSNVSKFKFFNVFTDITAKQLLTAFTLPYGAELLKKCSLRNSRLMGAGSHACLQQRFFLL